MPTIAKNLALYFGERARFEAHEEATFWLLLDHLRGMQSALTHVSGLICVEEENYFDDLITMFSLKALSKVAFRSKVSIGLKMLFCENAPSANARIDECFAVEGRRRPCSIRHACSTGDRDVQSVGFLHLLMQ